MDAERVMKKIADDIRAASAAVEGPDSDLYAYGQRLAYTNALAIILDDCSSEYLLNDEDAVRKDEPSHK